MKHLIETGSFARPLPQTQSQTGLAVPSTRSVKSQDMALYRGLINVSGARSDFGMAPAVRTLDALERLAAGESADGRKVAVNHGKRSFVSGAG